MSNKYEREIEEILRNLERNEPKGRFGLRPQKPPRRPVETPPGMTLPQLSFSEWCLLLALAAGLAAGGWAYANGASFITGAIALAGAVCVLLVALSNFLPNPNQQKVRER